MSKSESESERAVTSAALARILAHWRFTISKLRQRRLARAYPSLRFTTNTRPSASHVCECARGVYPLLSVTIRCLMQLANIFYNTIVKRNSKSVRRYLEVGCLDRPVSQVFSSRRSSPVHSRSASALTLESRSCGIRGTKECVVLLRANPRMGLTLFQKQWKDIRYRHVEE